MKKMMIAVASVAMALAFVSCDDDSEKCWEVTTTITVANTANAGGSVYQWMTKSQVEDLCDAGTVDRGDLGSTKMTYKKVSDSKCGK